MEEIITTQSATFRNLISKIDTASAIVRELQNAHKIGLCGENYLSGEEFCHRFHISRRTLQDYRDN